MIQFKYNIENISKYQCGNLPDNSIKLKAPATEEIQKKAFPIADVLCAVMFIPMFLKSFSNHMSVIEPICILVVVILGFILLFVHEILHAVVYPKSANVTIGNLKNKFFFVALASYPLKRSRFIFMSLLPLVLGIVPLLIFIISPLHLLVLNSIMFGTAYLGMISPYPDIYNVIIVLKQTKKHDHIMFYGDDMYRIPNVKQKRAIAPNVPLWIVWIRVNTKFSIISLSCRRYLHHKVCRLC